MVDTPTTTLNVNRQFDRLSLAFPENLVSYDYWMTFAFYQYKRPLVGSRNPNVSATTGGTIIAGQTFRLPLPNQMVDSQDVTYSEEDLGLAAGMGVNAYQSMNGGVGSVAALAAGVLASKSPVEDALTGKKAQLLGQLAGVTANPFLTVMFKSPKFKRHQFSWRLSPTNITESQKLNTILTMLRSNQLPDMSGSAGGALLTYPNIVQINVSNPSSFLYRFKPAVIETLSINFTPGGQPSFFGSSKAPTEVEIRLSILEIEFYLQRDYADPSTAGLNLVGEAGAFLQKGVDEVKSVSQELGAVFVAGLNNGGSM